MTAEWLQSPSQEIEKQLGVLHPSNPFPVQLSAIISKAKKPRSERNQKNKSICKTVVIVLRLLRTCRLQSRSFKSVFPFWSNGISVDFDGSVHELTASLAYFLCCIRVDFQECLTLVPWTGGMKWTDGFQSTFARSSFRKFVPGCSKAGDYPEEPG